MKPNVFAGPSLSSTGDWSKWRVPVWLKWAYTAFMLVLVPVYWENHERGHCICQ